MVESGASDSQVYTAPDVVEKPYGLYPGVDSFSADNGADDYREWVEQSNGDPLPAPLALYVQDIAAGGSPPVRGRDMSSSRRLGALQRELRLQGALFDSDRPVQQLICSASIATDWTDEQLYRLVSTVQDSFQINQGGLSDWCVSLGPVVPSPERLRLLRVLGFSNVRFVFINQPDRPDALDELKAAINAARQFGIHNISLDLVHTRPGVTVSRQEVGNFLAETGPDRIWLKVDDERQYSLYIRLLCSLGYRNIGNDCFLRSDDSWLLAKMDGCLHWSLLGFTPMAGPDVIGIGPGALSSVGDCYAVNEACWDKYEDVLIEHEFPVVRGLELEDDDVLRREIMRMILAGSAIPVSAIEEKWGIRFNQFFVEETGSLRRFEENGWIDWQEEQIRVQVHGHRQLTELCRVFDHRARLMSARSPDVQEPVVSSQLP
jgi:oxygen-independent coproporphyrinogen-3 oxidase